MPRSSLARLAALPLALLALAAVLFSGAARADEATPVKIKSASFDPVRAERGGKAKLKVEFSIDAGWHMYPQGSMSGPPEFVWKASPGLTPGKLEDADKPNAESFGDPAYEHAMTVLQTFDVAADAPLGRVELKGTANWTRCDASVCVPDKMVPVSVSLEVVAAPGEAAPPLSAQVPALTSLLPQQQPLLVPAPDTGSWSPGPPAGAASLEGPEDQPGGAKNQSLWEVILTGLGAGAITILTPCVFPLLPVTVSFFSKQKGPALPRALVYAAGIVFTITVIGLVFSSSLDAFARGWAFNLAVAILFFVLSLSLFGLFDLRLPSFLVNWSTDKAGSGGFMGPFFMAVTLALTSFSCSVPFLALMFEGFRGGGKATAVIGLLVYSVTLAAPFFLCALFPAGIRALPKAGGWMNSIKVVMGFVELALAWKFLRTVDLDAFPRGVVLAIWAACAFGASAYLLGFITLPHDTKTESIGVGRLLFALGFLATALYLVPGIQGKPIANSLEAFLQSRPEEIEGGPSEHIPFIKNDWGLVRDRAASADKPILLDFTGVG